MSKSILNNTFEEFYFNIWETTEKENMRKRVLYLLKRWKCILEIKWRNYFLDNYIYLFLLNIVNKIL